MKRLAFELGEVTPPMPTYVYACDTCGAQFEKFQRFSDEPVRACPRCEAPVRRVFQPVGIVFKGAGWYITDSRKGGENGAASSNGDAKKETAEKAGDAKPADAKPADAKPADAKPADAKPAPAAKAAD